MNLLPADRDAEAGLICYCIQFPDRTEEIIRRAPVGIFQSTLKSLYAGIFRLNQKGLTNYSNRNITNAALEEGFSQEAVNAAWRLFEQVDGMYMSSDINRCISSIRQAHVSNHRTQEVSKLWELVDDPATFREQLEHMLHLEKTSADQLSNLPKTETVEELDKAILEPAISILGDGLLNKNGLMWIHSGSGTGKTFLALQLAGALAGNRRWLGFDTPEDIVKVLYLQGELDRPWWQKRTRALKKFIAGDLSTLMFCHERFALCSWERRTWRIRTAGLRKLGGLVLRDKPDVVIVDPFYKFYSLEESSTDQNREFDNIFYDWRHEYGITVIIVHHDRKYQSGDDTPQMRGSSVFEAGADSVVQLAYRDKGRKMELVWDKVRHAPKPATVELIRRYGFFELAEEKKEKEWE